jgi:CubicO group peptidase (beta-lactamase class C family)
MMNAQQYFWLFPLLILALMMPGCHQPEKTGREVVYPFAGVDSAQVEVVLEGLTLEEKIGQLIVWKTTARDSAEKVNLFNQVIGGKAGGLLLEKLPLSDFLYTSDSLRRIAKLPLLMGTAEKVSLHDQFAYLPHFPLPASMATIDSSGLHRLLERHYIQQCKALGINFSLNPTLKMDDPEQPDYDFQTFENEEHALLERSNWITERLRQNRILAFGDSFSDFKFAQTDSIRDSLLHRFQLHTRAGLTGLLVDDKAFNADTLQSASPHFVKNYLKRYLDFNGLVIAKLDNGETPEFKWQEGTDLFITRDAEGTFQALETLLANGKISEQDIDRRVRLVLIAKSWVNGGRLPVRLTVFPVDSVQQPVKLVSFSEKSTPRIYTQPVPRSPDFHDKAEEIICYFEDPGWGHLIGNLYENSVVLARNHQGVLPFKALYDANFQLFMIGNQPYRTFENFFFKYAGFNKKEIPVPPSGALEPLNAEGLDSTSTAVILLDSVNLLPGFHQGFIESVKALGTKCKVTLVNFGNPKNLRYFDNNISCIQVFERNDRTESYAAQLLFGGVTAGGRMPLALDAGLPYGTANRQPATRLGYAPSEQTGIAPERLVGINAIAETAIDRGVFPGCQVVVAKDGKVIFSKGFGQHTYGKHKRAVLTTDLYDIASLTKIAATTIAVMSLVEKQKIDLKGRVGDYLALPGSSAVRDISIKELLLHTSGLQAQMPITRLYSHRNVPAKGCNDIYCRKRRGSYGIKIADGLYLRNDYPDTIWKRVYNLPVSGKKRYRYSDVNFFLLQRIVEKVTRTPMDQYVSDHFYASLGLRRTLFKPLEKYGRASIVPTEKDNYWRKTLVHGYVHDPAAALMGGVGGNSGVFSNAEDLAVLFQMLLNEGRYGGIQFFDPQTIQDFTTAKYTNHRGLGFDKPVNRRYPTYSKHTSPDSFGHTGFTGTCVWVDPEQKLVYVFLSNRVNPSARNGKIFTEETRSRIHEIVYNALGTFEVKLPELTVEQEELIEEEGD